MTTCRMRISMSFCLLHLANMEQSMEQDASIYVFHADTEGLNFRKAFKDAGFYLPGAASGRRMHWFLEESPYQWQHEPCLFGWKRAGSFPVVFDRKQTTIWEYDRPKASKGPSDHEACGAYGIPIQNSCMSNTASCLIVPWFRFYADRL